MRDWGSGRVASVYVHCEAATAKTGRRQRRRETELASTRPTERRDVRMREKQRCRLQAENGKIRALFERRSPRTKAREEEAGGGRRRGGGGGQLMCNGAW